ncbi:hypothetical protein P7K49_022091 [Saguinus oedipus]|uniref:Uncharacterized protein n=1 Tax=Saguinus oedipus TaxID=9490 RepID=A0ABQ9UUF8_SAGOE|nr:hypothetical protein P7K49_022091 [Saguinus oedipus]
MLPAHLRPRKPGPPQGQGQDEPGVGAKASASREAGRREPPFRPQGAADSRLGRRVSSSASRALTGFGGQGHAAGAPRPQGWSKEGLPDTEASQGQGWAWLRPAAGAGAGQGRLRREEAGQPRAAPVGALPGRGAERAEGRGPDCRYLKRPGRAANAKLESSRGSAAARALGRKRLPPPGLRGARAAARGRCQPGFPDLNCAGPARLPHSRPGWPDLPSPQNFSWDETLGKSPSWERKLH